MIETVELLKWFNDRNGYYACYPSVEGKYLYVQKYVKKGELEKKRIK